MSRPMDLGNVDLAAEGVPLSTLADAGVVAGQVDGDPVVVGRTGDGEFWAIAGSCSHYGGPLHEGYFDGTSLRCPWHHARFDVSNGCALAAPAFDAVESYGTRVEGDRLLVEAKQDAPTAGTPPRSPESVVVLGGGAAGFAAIHELRSRGYGEPITLITEDPDLPYDRPNLSKDYLAGEAEDDWLPLRDDGFYEEHDITVRRGVRASRLDTEHRMVVLEDGQTVPYDALLLATGSTPIELDIERDGASDVRYLRSLRDADAIINLVGDAGSALVVGASFIGTEVAASLRKRDLEVTVVDQAPLPMAHVLGDDLGLMVKSVHEEHGVSFKLGRTVARLEDGTAMLDDGDAVPAPLVVIGVGVRPNTQLAEEAGLLVDNGVIVDSHLRTSTPRIWAAGDIAAWPDARSDGRIRVEHWVVAERQGQTAARNILGYDEPFDEVPFFWSQHFDLQINYVGHAEQWDEARWTGDAASREGVVSYRRDGRVQAVATVGRDATSLDAEVAMENGDEAALERALAG